jgi:urease accessory protein
MTRSANARRLLAVIALIVLSAEPMFAHEQTAQARSFLTGFLHPLSGPDHVVAMIAVGLWGAQLGLPALWLLPVTFPMVMAFGGFLGLVGVPIPHVELGIAFSAVLLGLMVATEARPQMVVAATLVGLFAIFHGHAHGTELPAGQSGLMYSIGFVVATGCLHACGIALGLAHKWRSGRLAIRIGGTAIACAGCVFLWRSIW